MKFYRHRQSGHLVIAKGREVARLTAFGPSVQASPANVSARPRVDRLEAGVYLVTMAGRSRRVRAMRCAALDAAPADRGAVWRELPVVSAMRLLMTARDPAAGQPGVPGGWYDQAMRGLRDRLESWSGFVDSFLAGLDQVEEIAERVGRLAGSNNGKRTNR